MTDTPFDLCLHDDRFGAVADAFRENFSHRDEIGAQFSVRVEGRPALSLIGGWADRRSKSPIRSDTLVSVYSSGKAAAALTVALMVERGHVAYDTPVADIWPALADHGKAGLTVAQLMSHQAGLSGITQDGWSPGDWYDWDKVVSALEAQVPLFPPGRASGYHPVTFGFLSGEIVRRSDPGGRTLGQVLAQDICAPAGIDVHIGLPESQHPRVARMRKPASAADFGEITPATRAAFLSKGSSPGGHGWADWVSAELAGSNCQASADGLATLMEGFTPNGSLLSERTREAAREVRISGRDLVLPFDVSFAAGVMRNQPRRIFGPNPETVGHFGWGGSCVFADPDAGVTGAYAMTRQSGSLMGDPRAQALIDAVYACL